jgi:gentisate 1,2-dioxygenase
MTVIETTNAPGFGPPRHRHPETEVFRVMQGRYLYEVDGRRFFAEAGDLVTVPGGAVHGFVNVTDEPASQLIMIVPGLDAQLFFTELGGVMHQGVPDPVQLADFGRRWNAEFVGSPVSADEGSTE